VKKELSEIEAIKKQVDTDIPYSIRQLELEIANKKKVELAERSFGQLAGSKHDLESAKRHKKTADNVLEDINKIGSQILDLKSKINSKIEEFCQREHNMNKIFVLERKAQLEIKVLEATYDGLIKAEKYDDALIVDKDIKFMYQLLSDMKSLSIVLLDKATKGKNFGVIVALLCVIGACLLFGVKQFKKWIDKKNKIAAKKLKDAQDIIDAQEQEAIAVRPHHTGFIIYGNSGYQVHHPDGGGDNSCVGVWNCCGAYAKNSSGCQKGPQKHHSNLHPYEIQSYGDDYNWGFDVVEKPNFCYSCCGGSSKSPGCLDGPAR
jgi:hypothetical protein